MRNREAASPTGNDREVHIRAEGWPGLATMIVRLDPHHLPKFYVVDCQHRVPALKSRRRRPRSRRR